MNPSSGTQQALAVPPPKPKFFFRVFHQQVCGISLVGSFHPLGP